MQIFEIFKILHDISIFLMRTLTYFNYMEHILPFTPIIKNYNMHFYKKNIDIKKIKKNII